MPKVAAFAGAGALAVLLAAAMGSAALAQDYDMEVPLDEFPEEETFSARMVGDYVVVANDDYCRTLIGTTFGPTARYLPEEMVGETREVQNEGLTRFAAPGDANTTFCADVLSGLGGTILPESLAGLLELGGVAEPSVPSGEDLTINGSGPWVSGRFRLDGGTYLANVAASTCASWDALLLDASGEPVMAEPITESDLLEEVEPGVYYWSIFSSDCDWSLRMLPEQD